MKIVKKVLNRGASECFVISTKTTSCNVEIERDKISSTEWVQSIGLTIYTIVGKRIASVTVRDLSEDSIKKAIDLSYKLANSVTPNIYWSGLPEPKSYPTPLETYDPKLRNLDVDEVVELAKTCISTVKDFDKRVSIAKGGVTISYGEVSIANSNGIEGDDYGTLFSVYLLTLAKSASEISSYVSEEEYSRKFDIDVEEVALRAAKRAIETLGAKSVRSFKGDVVFDYYLAADLFTTLSIAYNGDYIWRGSSPLKNKLGEEIAVNDLTIIDDGLLPGGIETSKFDGEGTPRQRTLIIEKGVLKNFINNTYTARILNMEPTGNASSLLTVSPSNIVVKPGSSKLEDLISEVKKGLLIREFSGMMRFQDGVISGTVKQSFYIENGEIKYPVKECMISDNLYSMLKRIDGISKETRRVYNVLTPCIRVRDVTIIGK